MTAFKLARPLNLSMTGSVSVSGDVELTTIPTWLPAVGEWGEISGSTFSASGVLASTMPTAATNIVDYSGGILNTVGVYSGGAFVSGIHLVLFGGGHLDYAGNEVYAFGPLGGIPTWRRLTDPTDPPPEDQGRDGSDRPVSRHTYDTLVYSPVSNAMVAVGATFAYSAANSYATGDLFEFGTDPGSGDPWVIVDTGFPTFAANMTSGLVSGYDTSADVAWGLGKGNGTKLVRFNFADNSWDEWAIDNPNHSGNVQGAFDTAREVLAYVNGSGVVYAVDCRTPTATVYAPSTTGTGPAAGHVFVHDPVDGVFMAGDGSGQELWTLTPGANPYSGGDSWSWASVSVGGVTPASGAAAGTYGRGRFVNETAWAGLLLMGSPTAPINFFRVR